MTQNQPKANPLYQRLATLPAALPLAISAVLLLTLSGCGNDDKSTRQSPHYAPTELTIAHINDHHSHLEPEGSQSFMFNGNTYTSERGGFARITQLYEDLQARYAGSNFLKLHAGDAITGTKYYSFYQGDADADMMNTVCFDAFALGNHEFDDGDAALVRFIDRLHQGSCQTPVLAANVKPKVGTPLAMTKVDDYIKPYTITTTKEGVKVAIIGIDIAGKTQNSSRPLATTEFLDEVTTAQNYINEVKNQGIKHIILLTHYTYGNDIELAKQLTDVDVIIGGDSHTLLGDFTHYTKSPEDNFGSQGAYPTKVQNKDGDTVCIGQAWEYTKALGLMQVTFNNKGSVDRCHGSAIIPVAQQFKRYDEASSGFVALSAADNASLLASLTATSFADLLKKDVIYPIAPNAAAAAVLMPYTEQMSEKMAEVIGTSSQPLCLVRVPGTTRSADIAGCEDSASHARGSDIAQVVAKAFLYGSLRADFALQNAGGVRESIQTGNVSNDIAYTVLPFSNTMVNLDITGQQVIDTLEEAIANHMDNGGSSGSHPYADGLRWDLQLNQPRGNRVKNVEVRDRHTGTWSAIDVNRTYVMVTNDFIAEGRDGYTTLGVIFKDASKVEDTKLLYSQSFIDYIKQVQTLSRPARDDYAHKTVITADGTMLAP